MAVNKVVYAGVTLIDLTGITVTADKVAEGFTAMTAAGELVEGTLEECEALTEAEIRAICV